MIMIKIRRKFILASVCNSIACSFAISYHQTTHSHSHLEEKNHNRSIAQNNACSWAHVICKSNIVSRLAALDLLPYARR
jgi:hypothetical protein